MKRESIAADLTDFLTKSNLGVRATNVLFKMGFSTTAGLAALDEKTLLRTRNCGKKTAAEILNCIRCYLPEIRSESAKQAALGRAQENTPVSELRLSVRAGAVLERLNILTVGQLAKSTDAQLLKVQNCGRLTVCELREKLASFSDGLIIWPEGGDGNGQLNPQITRLARKLLSIRSASGVYSCDPRLGHFVREMGVGAETAREAAEIILRRKVDPTNPERMTKRLIALIKEIKTAQRRTLEQELWKLTEGLSTERNRQIFVQYLGWDGKPPRTLEAVGQRFNMTRERVRQICRPLEIVIGTKPFLPVLDRALHRIKTDAPVIAERFEAHLKQSRLTDNGFAVESLAAAARALGRDPGFELEALYNHRVVVPNEDRGIFTRLDQAARAATSHWGVANVQDVAATVKSGLESAERLLPLLSGFKWLDQPTGWFWIENCARNSLLTQIRKVLAASSQINVGELRTAVGRHHRRKGFAPPRRVLLELCRQLSWCRVDGEKIFVPKPLNAKEILSNTEYLILRVFTEHGPVLQKSKLEPLCLAAGMNPHSFLIYLTYSPLICRHAPGVYALRGADIPVGLVESMIPKRSSTAKLLIDYGWVENKIYILYKISAGTLANGIVSIPSALKKFVQGKFGLVAAEGLEIGTIVARNNSAWGLGPFFTRRGGEPGDYLSIVFDLGQRVATVQVGDSDLGDEFQRAPANRQQQSPKPDANESQLEWRL